MNYEHSIVVNKTRCPKCAKLGMDTRGDNLVNYSDGHSFCYSCGYLSNPLSTRLSNLTIGDSVSVAPQEPIKLPSDIGIDYPQKVIDWIVSYELTITDLHNHNFLWSESYQRLLYPIWGNEAVLFWTGRYFGIDPGKAKWTNKGSPRDLIHCINRNAKVIIIVEDVISGIKITNICKDIGCLVLFNSHNPIMKLSKGKDYVLWLDRDKFKDSLIFSKEANSRGFKMRVVNTREDPKAVSRSDIIKETYG